MACAEDELVVMCPAWMVGDRLGPGRHRWRTPDPSRPVSAYFVLTAPVEVSFDMITQFVIPMTGQPVRLRGSGSLQVRCMDPALLVAQFVGLPFDAVNDGVLRSVSRSIERMLARLLTRRVVMAGMPQAVTDPQMLPSIIEELVAYNPAAGAVFGVELVRFGHLSILADDGSRPWQQMAPVVDYSSNHHAPHANGESRTPASLLETVRAPRPQTPTLQAPPLQQPPSVPPAAAPAARPKGVSNPPPIPSIPKLPRPSTSSDGRSEVSGEIGSKQKTTAPGHAQATPPAGVNAVAQPDLAEGTPNPNRAIPTPVPRRAASVEVPQSTDEITHPGLEMRAKGEINSSRSATVGGEIGGNKVSSTSEKKTSPETPAQESRGAILGIGVGHIGASTTSSSSSGNAASGEIGQKIAPGHRVLVPGPNGLMQSATVRQLLQGYYELEVGGSGETIWVPMNGVVPE
ncbi:MAG: hypothetical protein HOV81_19950 [Kofleriaceae bacterium]|nr:hypothetical protein [Kofleriaceae bacterium]